MKKINTELKDCFVIEPSKFEDERGYFSPYFNTKELKKLGFKNPEQGNRSKSCKGVVRGLHFQKDPKCQTKLVEVIHGSAIDVVVDMRVDSPTYGKYTAVKLTDENNRQLFVPRGFAHGFIALEDDTIFQYVVDNDYAKDKEAGIAWNDKDLGINWEEMFNENNIENPILSEKDLVLPKIKDNEVVFSKKYLITGYNGQLGYDIKRELIKRGVPEENILATDIEQMDITNREEVFRVIKTFEPDVIYHCAAWTAVDKAEGFELDDIANIEKRIEEKKKLNELVNKINVLGTKNITDASKEIDAKLFYMSTDYVFDGTKEGEYTEEDEVNPLSVYGKTKFLGEEEVRKNPKHFITRISWVFGINGNNFIKTMLKLADKYEEISVVDDQIGSPTYTVDLAKLLADMAYEDNYGTYHVNNNGFCSWAEFAEEIFRINNKNVKVNHVSTEEYSVGKKQAYRPKNSKLSKEKLVKNGYEMLPDWQDAVERYSKELILTKKGE